MIKIESNAAVFSQQLAAAIAALDEQVTYEFRRWTHRIFYDLVVNTPQWSGDTAANWRYSIGSPSGAYQAILNKALGWQDKYKGGDFVPFQRGHHLAVEGAISRMEDGAQPQWTDKVFFTNNTPIAPELETSPAWVRPVNLLPGPAGVVAMVSYTVNKWKNLPA